GRIAAAGKRPEDIRPTGRFEEWHRGGWDPEARLADQERDGVSAEVLYPTVGLVLCRHPDLDYKQACMDAYNRWLAEYCSAHPDRLLGVGQTAVRTPADGIADLRRIKALGLRGVMLPSRPGQADWDSPIYDELFEATIALGLPVSFHILTDPQDAFPTRGSASCAWRRTRAGHPTGCIAWTTTTSATATCARSSSRGSRASTSGSTCISPSRTTGRHSG